MALGRRTKMLMVAAGLAGAGTVAGAGAALAAGPEPGPVHTRLQIVEHKVTHAGTPGRDCADKGGAAVAEGTR
ncbi:hypothetical protein [Actinomadura sp. 6K520]|uniref:hypothetical protein n=1 Tax=Actinomadura sp. 6K520 TaxID=2530364 RepID=UPI0010527F99|nr:hypothetical protein [Actinomadura sp. 6K520]TDE33487.1 hypothetical protein E1289_12315 [Actinomadura sp. 6K520]